MRILFILLNLSLIFQVNAQNRFVNWFFGYGSGIKFTQSGPLTVSGGQSATLEGSATISTPCGNLLFYSDGRKIYNKKHQVMVNGSGLFGHIQSAEAVLIVPMPLSDSLYYVFTAYSYGNDTGLQYNIVDMSRQAGDGEVISKNNKVYAKSSEKICAVLHRNKKDYWILSHDWQNNEFKVFLLTESGLNTTPVISKLGPATNTSVENAIGHLRPSPDGKLVVSTFWYQGILELYNFDNNSGSFSLKIKLTNFVHIQPYSIEFSPNNKILYVGEAKVGSPNDIYQFDLTASDIPGSRYKLTTDNNRFGDFVLGPDGKFYIAKYQKKFLDIVANPDIYGPGCGFTSNGFNMGSQTSQFGLNNIIHPIVIQDPEYAISAIPGCKLSDPVKFELLSNFCYDSLVWDLSDFTSSENFSRKRRLSHIYPYKGNYDITLTVYYNGKTYTYNKNVKVPAGPVVDLGKDMFFCDKFSYFLDAGNAGASYLWQDSSTVKYRNATTPGKYKVTVTLGSCKATDSMVISNASSLDLGRDTTLCYSNMYNYTLSNADSVIWKNGKNSKTLIIAPPGGNFIATVYKNGCSKVDTISILLPELYNNPLPADTSICEGESITISLPNTAITYLWSDGSTSGNKSITKAGFYQLTQSFGKCSAKNAFNLKLTPKINLPNINDTSICRGDTLYIKTNLSGAPLEINGAVKNGNRHTFYIEGPYFLRAENICFKDSLVFNLSIDSRINTEVIFPNVFSPNDDMLNEFYKPVVIGDPSKISNYDFSIYNRWGEKVFGSMKYSNGWDGYYLHNPCPMGYYVWTCNLKLLHSGEPKSFQLKGTIILIR